MATLGFENIFEILATQGNGTISEQFEGGRVPNGKFNWGMYWKDVST